MEGQAAEGRVVEDRVAAEGLVVVEDQVAAEDLAAAEGAISILKSVNIRMLQNSQGQVLHYNNLPPPLMKTRV